MLVLVKRRTVTQTSKSESVKMKGNFRSLKKLGTEMPISESSVPLCALKLTLLNVREKGRIFIRCRPADQDSRSRRVRGISSGISKIRQREDTGFRLCNYFISILNSSLLKIKINHLIALTTNLRLRFWLE